MSGRLAVFTELQTQVTALSIDPILLASIEDLQLTTRASNCLKGEGIQTIGQLVCQAERDLFIIPNLGRKSLSEIKAALLKRGLSLSSENETRRWDPSPFQETRSANGNTQQQGSTLENRFKSVNSVKHSAIANKIEPRSVTAEQSLQIFMFLHKQLKVSLLDPGSRLENLTFTVLQLPEDHRANAQSILTACGLHANSAAASVKLFFALNAALGANSISRIEKEIIMIKTVTRCGTAMTDDLFNKQSPSLSCLITTMMNQGFEPIHPRSIDLDV